MWRALTCRATIDILERGPHVPGDVHTQSVSGKKNEPYWTVATFTSQRFYFSLSALNLATVFTFFWVVFFFLRLSVFFSLLTSNDWKWKADLFPFVSHSMIPNLNQTCRLSNAQLQLHVKFACSVFHFILSVRLTRLFCSCMCGPYFPAKKEIRRNHAGSGTDNVLLLCSNVSFCSSARATCCSWDIKQR